MSKTRIPLATLLALLTVPIAGCEVRRSHAQGSEQQCSLPRIMDHRLCQASAGSSDPKLPDCSHHLLCVEAVAELKIRQVFCAKRRGHIKFRRATGKPDYFECEDSGKCARYLKADCPEEEGDLSRYLPRYVE